MFNTGILEKLQREMVLASQPGSTAVDAGKQSSAAVHLFAACEPSTGILTDGCKHSSTTPEQMK